MNGVHACKFYTGRPHLISSLMIEAQKAVNEDKQFIYFTEEDFNDKLRAYFTQIKKINGFEAKLSSELETVATYETDLLDDKTGFDITISRFSPGEADFLNFYDSKKRIYDAFKTFIVNSSELGFKGVMLCIQMDQVYYSLGEAKLLILEQNLDYAAKETGIELICFYDIFKSYKNNIVEKIIDMHEYAVHCSKRYKVEELFG